VEFSNDDLKRAAASIAAERTRRATAHPEVEALVAYHTGELTDARAEEIREHLAACRACGDLVLELHRVDEEERRPWTRFTEWIARRTDPLRATGSVTDRALEAGYREQAIRRSVLAGIAALILVVPAAFIAYRAAFTLTGPPLGAYGMTLHGAIKTTRGAGESEAPEPYAFAPGMTFDLNLFPSEPVTGELDVAAFRSRDGAFERWEVPVEVSPEGAVRISGRLGTGIDLPMGPSVVMVAVGREGRVPGGNDLRQRFAATDRIQEHDWSAWLLRVVVVEQGTSP
jgi:hypothetical protein